MAVRRDTVVVTTDVRRADALVRMHANVDRCGGSWWTVLACEFVQVVSTTASGE